MAGNQDKKWPSSESQRAISSHPFQNRAYSGAGSGAVVCAGVSASARLNRRTELASVLHKRASFAALPSGLIAVLPIAPGVDELSVNKDMVALVQRDRNGLG